MLVLGLLLVLGAAVITVGAFVDAGESATVEILGQTLTTTAAGVFVIGALTMLMFLLGVWALKASMSRSRRKRMERKTARSRHRDSVKSLEEERESLRLENERLAEQLRTREGATAGAGAAGAGGAATAGAMSHDDYSTDRSSHDRHGEGGHDGLETTGTAGHRSFMDRVTGRHESEPATTGSGATYDSTDSQRSDRVIDQDSDLRTNESTTSSRNRDI
jgi:hypothetical protein